MLELLNSKKTFWRQSGKFDYGLDIRLDFANYGLMLVFVNKV